MKVFNPLPTFQFEELRGVLQERIDAYQEAVESILKYVNEKYSHVDVVDYDQGLLWDEGAEERIMEKAPVNLRHAHEDLRNRMDKELRVLRDLFEHPVLNTSAPLLDETFWALREVQENA